MWISARITCRRFASASRTGNDNRAARPFHFEFFHGSALISRQAPGVDRIGITLDQAAERGFGAVLHKIGQ